MCGEIINDSGGGSETSDVTFYEDIHEKVSEYFDDDEATDKVIDSIKEYIDKRIEGLEKEYDQRMEELEDKQNCDHFFINKSQSSGKKVYRCNECKDIIIFDD